LILNSNGKKFNEYFLTENSKYLLRNSLATVYVPTVAVSKERTKTSLSREQEETKGCEDAKMVSIAVYALFQKVLGSRL
jgi:hypothetical protein